MWNIENERATWSAGEVLAEVNLRDPQEGISRIKIGGQEIAGRLLAPCDLTNETPLLEAYQRGNDLVVTYEAAGDRTVRTQIYWRVLPGLAEGVVGFEIILSVQTDLLDSQPLTTISTQLSEGAAYRGTETSEGELSFDRYFQGSSATVATLVRGTEFSLLEQVHPTDYFGQVMLEDTGRVTIDRRVFPEGLEKGVIRRARFQAFLMPRSGDVESAKQLFAAFDEAAPPLTT
ncbi:MAG: hypothetical protein ACI9G1_004837 [Pirellulaceae bacterium]|jgi:hypothetical protein